MKRFLWLLTLPLILAGQSITDDISWPLTEPLSTSLDDGFHWGVSGFIPSQVLNLVVDENVPGAITICWDDLAPEPIQEYLIYRDTSTGPTTVEATVSGSETCYTDTNVVDSTTYYYQVSAVSTDALEGLKSNEVNATAIGAPAVPTVSLADADAYYLSSMVTEPDIFAEDWVEQDGGGAVDLENDFTTSLVDAGENYQQWEPFGDGSFARGDFVDNGTFDSDTLWTKDTGWTISGNVASCNAPASVRSIKQAHTDEITRYQIYHFSYDVLNYSAGYTNMLIGGNVDDYGTTVTANGTYTGLILTTALTTQEVDIRGTNFVGDIDNVVVQRMEPLGGDYWTISDSSGTGNQLNDNADWDLHVTDDYALEMRVAAQDWSAGFQAILADYVGGNQKFWFGINAGGAPHHGAAETASGGFGTNIGAATIYTIKNWQDGLHFPIWMRWEFDYDDGASQSRMRVGFSVDRGQLDDWEYTVWQNIGSGLLDYYDGTGDIDFGQHNGGDIGEWRIWDVELFDERDEFFDDPDATLLYDFNPWEHNQDGTTVGHASTLTVSRAGTGVVFGPHLVTRDNGWHADGFSANYWLPSGAPYTNLEDRSVVIYANVERLDTGAVRFIDSDNTSGAGGRVRLEHSVGGVTDVRGIFHDGTDEVTTATISFQTIHPQIFGIAIDSTNFYVHSDGTTQTTSRGSATDSLDWPRDLQLAYNHAYSFGFAVFPSVLTDADFDGLKTVFDQALEGESSEDTAPRANKGAGGSVVYNSDTVEPGFNDTWIVLFQGETTAADYQFQVDEVELYESTDGTGTNVAENTDTAEATRAQYPYARAIWINGDSVTKTGSTIDEYHTNRMIDGDTGTNFQSTLTNILGNSVPDNNTFISISLENPTKVRSLKIKFTSTSFIPTDFWVIGKNRDGTNGTGFYGEFTPAGVTTLQSFNNLQ